MVNSKTAKRIEHKLRLDSVGDKAHQALFKLADELESKDPVKYTFIIKRCRNGHYHDFATKAAMPKMDMHIDLCVAELFDVDQRLQDGEFDS